jgi:hypothetical protein
LIETINALRGAVSLVFIAHERPPNLHCDKVVNLDARSGRGDG